jgi:hypothetical protein
MLSLQEIITIRWGGHAVCTEKDIITMFWLENIKTEYTFIFFLGNSNKLTCSPPPELLP